MQQHFHRFLRQRVASMGMHSICEDVSTHAHDVVCPWLPKWPEDGRSGEPRSSTSLVNLTSRSSTSAPLQKQIVQHCYQYVHISRKARLRSRHFLLGRSEALSRQACCTTEQPKCGSRGDTQAGLNAQKRGLRKRIQKSPMRIQKSLYPPKL